MGAAMLSGTRIRAGRMRLAMLLSILLLAACGDSQMAYVSGDDRSHSISIIREQSWLGGPWQTTLIVAAIPRCQRRYPLEGLVADEFRMDVHRPEPGVFILKAGQRWYVTETQNCGFQAYKKPPPEPGELIGGFQVQNDTLRYLDKAPAKAAPRGVAPAAATAK